MYLGAVCVCVCVRCPCSFKLTSSPSEGKTGLSAAK